MQQLSDQVATNLSAIVNSVQQLRDVITNNMSAIVSELDAVAVAVDQLEAGVPAISCGNFTIAHGSALGHGNLAGATRVLQCDPGYTLLGLATPVVVCHVDGNWSDYGSAQCVAASPSPTPAPTPAWEWVTCLLGVDQELVSAWADGRRLTTEVNSTLLSLGANYAGRIYSFRFPSTTQVMGIRALNDGGCRWGCVCSR
jgi:hypothetical protein